MVGVINMKPSLIINQNNPYSDRQFQTSFGMNYHGVINDIRRNQHLLSNEVLTTFGKLKEHPDNCFITKFEIAKRHVKRWFSNDSKEIYECAIKVQDRHGIDVYGESFKVPATQKEKLSAKILQTLQHLLSDKFHAGVAKCDKANQAKSLALKEQKQVEQAAIEASRQAAELQHTERVKLLDSVAPKSFTTEETGARHIMQFMGLNYPDALDLAKKLLEGGRVRTGKQIRRLAQEFANTTTLEGRCQQLELLQAKPN